jgi:hypothetical protein
MPAICIAPNLVGAVSQRLALPHRNEQAGDLRNREGGGVGRSLPVQDPRIVIALGYAVSRPGSVVSGLAAGQGRNEPMRLALAGVIETDTGVAGALMKSAPASVMAI